MGLAVGDKAVKASGAVTSLSPEEIPSVFIYFNSLTKCLWQRHFTVTKKA